MMRIGYLGVLVVIVAAAPVIGSAVDDCVSEAFGEWREASVDCGYEYREARSACNQDYLECKWDYMLCLFDLETPVFAIGCAELTLDCRQERAMCMAEAVMERDDCVQDVAYEFQMAKHECTYGE